MDSVEYLVVGAGVTGLSFANWMRQEAVRRNQPEPVLQIIEADREPGGYCKTVKRDGFVWDYSGHFFHFRHPDIEGWLRDRMPGQDIRTVHKRSFIRFAGRDIDFPFQKNIHQLPRADFIDCLAALYFRDEGHDPADTPRSFKDMLIRRFGAGIADRFLIPYNEKLYACDLDQLDVDAMGRFFPHADIPDIIRNMRRADNATYNATFSYPLGGAIEYINALLVDLPDGAVSYGERLEAVDLERRVARTSSREIEYERLVSSAPLAALAAMAGVAETPSVFSWNKVLVFNLGFDRKGPTEPHWIYFPDPATCFYRVGFYDNIMGSDRMSLYVEIGADKAATLSADAMLDRVLADLKSHRIVEDHALIASHSVVLDPAYVHITKQSLAAVDRLAGVLDAGGVTSAGRYGRWTYCSIEDNMVETRDLAARFAADR